MRSAWLPLVLLSGAGAAGPVAAQDFTQRGFLEFRPVVYFEDAPNDSGRVVTEALFRYTASYKFRPWLRANIETDARADTHRQDERSLRLDLTDRGLRRPTLSLRRASLAATRHGFTFELGKQFIRWGKADLLNPTDRFAPRDYLSVVDNNDFLGVTAARLTWEGRGTTVDTVYTPRFTPSRVPLLRQRWTNLPDRYPDPAGAPWAVQWSDLAARYPGGGQFGARVDHQGRGYEASLSFFEGYNHLPLWNAVPLRLNPAAPPAAGGIAGTATIGLERFYPQMTMVGGDAAVPLRWLTVKGEAAYFTSRTAQADEYVLYVIQLERQAGEWFFVGGYAGEGVTQRRTLLDFAPDRGLTHALLGRAGYTIDSRRSAAVECAARENGEGLWLRLEYSHLLGQHWRATASTALIRGDSSDFLGQYSRNSHLAVALRYSF
jgi:hypothetical protein